MGQHRWPDYLIPTLSLTLTLTFTLSPEPPPHPPPHPAPGEHGGVRRVMGPREARRGAEVLPPLALPPLRRACSSGAEERAEGGVSGGGAAEAAGQRACRLSAGGRHGRRTGRRSRRDIGERGLRLEAGQAGDRPRQAVRGVVLAVHARAVVHRCVRFFSTR